MPQVLQREATWEANCGDQEERGTTLESIRGVKFQFEPAKTQPVALVALSDGATAFLNLQVDVDADVDIDMATILRFEI